jgi:tRNA (adenine37-N6)-methyltransferase
MKLKAIGIIHSKYQKPSEAPRQGRNSAELSQIFIFEEYREGLQSIDKYKNLIVLYWLDRARKDMLRVIPPGKTRERGVFSSRSPSRPNPIAFCVVEVIKIEDGTITVRGLDALDKSPVLDIKPFIPELDCI